MELTNNSDMDKLISVKGLVIRTTPIIPDMKEGEFKISMCMHMYICIYANLVNISILPLSGLQSRRQSRH